MDPTEALEVVASTIDRHRATIVEVSHRIWEHPELCFEEHRAHDLLCEVLEANGLTVERGAFGLPTAFRARAGDPAATGPVLAVVCEYDALPEIGHACGHNVIAAAGLGAGLAGAAVVDALGGQLVVLGTPAEEGGGGKAHMIDAGALDGIDAAMMVHPADADLDAFWAIAIQELHVDYAGEAAHAAAAPHRGRNALDAAVLGYTAVAALRQHIEAHERVHGIFTAGGDKPNVVPHRASMQWYVRSGTTESLERLKPRVLAALESGALATGCTMTHRWGDARYEELRPNATLDRCYAVHAASVGRTVRSRAETPEFLGSTDMGNVSQRVPSLHPMIAVAPPGTAIHTPDFAIAAGGPGGDRAAIDGARIMASVLVDLWSDPTLVERARAELDGAT